MPFAAEIGIERIIRGCKLLIRPLHAKGKELYEIELTIAFSAIAEILSDKPIVNIHLISDEYKF